MSSVTASVSRTSAVPVPTSTWHIGISPKFPSSLVLSNDAAIESLVMDIPFLSVGLLGFGVLTFFFSMRRFNRLAFCVFASVIVAFVGAILDVGQVLIRGSAGTQADTDVSAVLPLLISRELSFAISIGFRFLFFWFYSSRPPRGERPLTVAQEQEARPSFLRMESDISSGSWARWGIAGGLLKYALFLATVAIPVLQLIWRLVAQFSRFGPIYNADGTMEIVVSALSILKLFANAWLSPLTPRWKTIRDYSPVITALLLGLGVAIGNILCFQFSETSLGRLLQAVELYILVLYVLISSFYHHRVRPSVEENLGRRSIASAPFEGIQATDRMSSFRLTPPSVSTPENVGGNLSSRTGSPNSKRLSSWLVPDANDFPRRGSRTERLASWLMNKRASVRKDQEQARLWNKQDMEGGNSPVDEKTGYAASVGGSPLEPRETTWRDPVYTSVTPNTARQRLERIATALEAPPTSFRPATAASPDGTISSFNVDTYRDTTEFLPPPRRQAQNAPLGSPVYGLQGIVRYHGDSSHSRTASEQSSGVESLLRQQAELDKSVAELQMFSPTSRTSVATTKLTVPGGQSESFHSEFSLSNFPAPPASLGGEDVDGAPGFVADEVPFAMMPPPPPMPAAVAEATRTIPENVREQSFPSTTRWSTESSAVTVNPTNRAFVGSAGTQYDVTSFIGDLTTPGAKVSFDMEEPKQTVSSVAEQSESQDVPAASVAPKSALRMRVPPPALILTNGEGTAAASAIPRRVKQGLPNRSRLNISNPVPRTSVDKSMVFERPRPVPPS